MRWLIIGAFATLAFGQIDLPTFASDGAAAYTAFTAWKKLPENRGLQWTAATAKYRAKLVAGGMAEAAADKTISIITSRDEGVFYDPVFTAADRKFMAAPNKLLMEAVAGVKPGRALDVGMGQGRNAIHLARLGWDVTGFDTSSAGLAEARKAAGLAKVKVNTVLASDEEFDFGTERWDLIAILYPVEKRSVYRVREALRRGGRVVVECAHKQAGGAPFEYETNELLKIFGGFRIVKYEDTMAEHEWARKRMRMVRIVAEKP